MQFDKKNQLYVLDGWRVLRIKDGQITAAALFSSGP